MPKNIWFLFFILIIYYYIVLTNEECQLTNNNDLIDDCNCHISDLNELNNQRLYPLLREIVNKNYFRFFPVNLRKKCQFWSDNGQCSRRTCAIKPCPIEKLPKPLRDKITHSNKDCLTIDKNSSLGLINKNLNDEGPKWLKNVYFIYLIELRAIYKAREFFTNQTYFTGNETDDLYTKDLIINNLLKEIQPFANYFNENNLFQNGNELLKIEFKEHFRNISHIMDCVECDKCKLWGKLQIQALGTALKILFSENVIQLQRSEIVSLINGFNRLSMSIYHLEHTFKTCIKKDT